MLSELVAFRQVSPAHAAVCAPGAMTAGEIAAFVEGVRPQGWRISGLTHFENGDPNPSPCPGVPGKVHYLLTREEE